MQMQILNQARQFAKKILSWIYIFLGAFIFFFAFNIQIFSFQLPILKFQLSLPYPNPSYNSISAMFFKKIQGDLLIKKMELIVTSPLDALWVQIGISLFLAFIVTLPILLYKLIVFFSPALKKKEKRAILKALVPSIILFVGGCVFAYYVLIPSTFKFLYPYVLAMGARPFFMINQFVSLVLILIAAVGLVFLLPIFMILLTRLGIVKPDIWKKNWRYAILIFLVLAAIITPDGTGITMILLAGPLTGLYLVGYWLSKPRNHTNQYR